MFAKCIFLIYFAISVRSSNDVLRSNYIFNGRLYNSLDVADKNVVYSPLSLHALLSLAYQGSTGYTEHAIKEFLKLPDKRATAIQYRDVLKPLSGETNLTIEVGTKAYVRDSFRLNENFRNVAKQSFLAELATLNMDNGQQAADEVNDWIRKKTHGKISQLAEAADFDRYTRSVLLNAVYFKGDWGIKFDKGMTETMPFHVSPTETVNCPMMHRLDYFYYEDDQSLNAQILMLKFQDRRFNFLVILPREKWGIAKLERAIATANLTDLRMSVSGREVDVYLPRFKVESKHDLKEPLTKLGLGQIFADNAEFPNIIDGLGNLTISKIAQRASIEINEEGGVASAATEVIVAVPISSFYQPPPLETFKADHPFLFLLTATLERKEDEFYTKDVILFMGKVNTPETVV